MIHVKIPAPPLKSDFCVDDNDIQRTEKINENIRKEERIYRENNTNISYILVYIIICILSGLLIQKYNYQMNDATLIFFSCIVGLFLMFPIGLLISNLLQNIEKKSNRTGCHKKIMNILVRMHILKQEASTKKKLTE